MAIIYSYPYDQTVNDADAWVGTDSITRKTKQYTAKAIADYLNIKGKIAVASQMNYQFITIPSNKAGTFAFASGSGGGTAWSNISSIVISNKDLSGQVVSPFLNYLVGENILFQDVSAKGSFGHYKMTGYTQIGTTDFYTLTLQYIGGSGSINIDHYYTIVNFTLQSLSDKTFVYEQVVPGITWNIQHDLDKFPSITVVDTAETVVVGDYTYIDKNNVTLNFSAQFAGKAYLN